MLPSFPFEQTLSFCRFSLPSRAKEAFHGHDRAKRRGCARLPAATGCLADEPGCIVSDWLRERGTNHSGYDKKVHACIFLSNNSEEKCQEQIQNLVHNTRIARWNKNPCSYKSSDGAETIGGITGY